MNVISQWKLTHDPAGGVPWVVLDYGWEINDELAWQLQRACEAVPLVDTNPVFLRPAGGQLFTLNVTVFVDLSDAKSAQWAMMTSLVAAQTSALKPLRVEVQGYTDGRYWQFASSYVTTSAPKRDLNVPTARVALSHTILASDLSYHS